MPDLADRQPRLVAEAPGVADLAEVPGADPGHGLDHVGVGAGLRAGLDHAAVLAGRRDQLPAFPDVVRDRLFDVTSLPAWQAQIADQRVPVVGRGDGDRVDVLARPAVCGASVEGLDLAVLLLGLLERRPRTAGSTSQTAASVMPGTLDTMLTCNWPRPRSPTTPTRTVSLAPSTRPEALVAGDEQGRHAAPATPALMNFRRDNLHMAALLRQVSGYLLRVSLFSLLDGRLGSRKQGSHPPEKFPHAGSPAVTGLRWSALIRLSLAAMVGLGSVPSP